MGSSDSKHKLGICLVDLPAPLRWAPRHSQPQACAPPWNHPMLGVPPGVSSKMEMAVTSGLQPRPKHDRCRLVRRLLPELLPMRNPRTATP